MSNRRSRPAARTRASAHPRHSRPSAPAAVSTASPSKAPAPAPRTASTVPSESSHQHAASSSITTLREHAAALWHSPALRVARTALRRVLHSWLAAAELVALGVIITICYSMPVTVRGFFDAANLWLAVVAVAGSTAFVTVVWPAARGARHIPRGDYRALAGGLVLATVALQWAAALLLIALALIFHLITPLGAGAFVAGAIGLLVNLALLCTVTVVLLPPFGAQVPRLVFLAWLALALFSYTASAPSVLHIAHLPLLPFGAAFAFGQTGQVGAAGLLALLVELAYIAGLIVLTGLSTPRRKRLRI